MKTCYGCIIILVLLICLLMVGVYYSYKWRPILSPANELPSYSANASIDDTIRIIMIGDSWAVWQSIYISDSSMSDLICKFTNKPVIFKSKGRGWAKTKEIYNMMFEESCSELNYCTQSLLEEAPDYCIVIAGINDAFANVGSFNYCTNYHFIINHLLALGIRPVIIEIPDVNLSGVFEKLPIKEKLCSIYRSFLTRSSLHDVCEYREDLLTYLKNTRLFDSVIYINKNKWNPIGYQDSALYRNDFLHLNKNGYLKLDSCIISEISNDYNSR